MKNAISIALAGAFIAGAMLSASAAQRTLSDQQRASNAYPIYSSQTTGNIEDRGYGILVPNAF